MINEFLQDLSSRTLTYILSEVPYISSEIDKLNKWNTFDTNDWERILENQPQLAIYCPREKLKKISYYKNYIRAVILIKSKRMAGISFLQKKLKIGFNESSFIMNDLEKCGFITRSITNFGHKYIINENLFLVDALSLAKNSRIN